MTNAEKSHYQIGLTVAGFWMGRCPTCNEIVQATGVEISQSAVVLAIKRHESEAHDSGVDKP